MERLELQDRGRCTRRGSIFAGNRWSYWRNQRESTRRAKKKRTAEKRTEESSNRRSPVRGCLLALECGTGHSSLSRFLLAFSSLLLARKIFWPRITEATRSEHLIEHTEHYRHISFFLRRKNRFQTVSAAKDRSKGKSRFRCSIVSLCISLWAKREATAIFRLIDWARNAHACVTHTVRLLKFKRESVCEHTLRSKPFTNYFSSRWSKHAVTRFAGDSLAWRKSLRCEIDGWSFIQEWQLFASGISLSLYLSRRLPSDKHALQISWHTFRSQVAIRNQLLAFTTGESPVTLAITTGPVTKTSSWSVHYKLQV